MTYKIDVSPCRVLSGYVAMVVTAAGHIAQVLFAATWDAAWTAGQQWIADAKAGRVEE